MLIARPKVAELTFQLFGRPLHPELFQVLQTCTVEREKYTAKIDITSAGHVVTLALGRVDARRGCRRGPSPAAENAAAAGLCAEGPAQRPRRLPRRGQLSNELPPRADRPRGVLDLSARVDRRRPAARPVVSVRLQRPRCSGGPELHQLPGPPPQLSRCRPSTPSRTITRWSKANRCFQLPSAKESSAAWSPLPVQNRIGRPSLRRRTTNWPACISQ